MKVCFQLSFFSIQTRFVSWTIINDSSWKLSKYKLEIFGLWKTIFCWQLAFFTVINILLGGLRQKSVAVDIFPEHLNQFPAITADWCFQAGCNCQTCSLEIFLFYCLQGTSCYWNFQLSKSPKIVIQFMCPRIFYENFVKLPTWFHPSTFQTLL